MPHFEMDKDDRDEYRWRFRADNGKVLAGGGKGYKAKADCQRGIDLPEQHAAAAVVEDESAR